MRAGLELDVLVAEKVMGYTWRKRTTASGKQIDCLWSDESRWSSNEDDFNRLADGRGVDWNLDQFSTDIAAAMKIANKIKGRHLLLQRIRVAGDRDRWECAVDWSRRGPKTAFTPELAICLSALDLVESERGATE